MTQHPHVRPHIDYLSKDYASFRQLMLDHLSVLVPGWTEQSASDLGLTLVELLAYAADHLSYYQDAVATEAYLDTARLRRSVRRHAQLRDYRMHDGCNARVWVQVHVDRDTQLPQHTQLLTRVSGSWDEVVILPRTVAYDDALVQQPIVFETMHNANLYAAHNEIPLVASGRGAYLVKGATRAVLLAEQPLQLRPGDVLLFEEVRSPETGRTVDADLDKRHMVRLTRVTAAKTAPQVDVEWGIDDALPFSLAIADYVDGEQTYLSVARGNIVLADHGRTTPQEELPPVPEGIRYRTHLRQPRLTYAVPYDHDTARRMLSASATIAQDPAEAMPALDLIELGTVPVEPAPEQGITLVPLIQHRGRHYHYKQWALQRDLLGSGVFSRDYMVEMEDDGLAYLRFGFGEAGWQPAMVNAVLLATYRVGGGMRGNIGQEAITHIVTNAEGIIGVRNPLPARGGTNPINTETARLHAPHAFKTWELPENEDAARRNIHAGAFTAQERCVTEEDYAAVAMRHDDVTNAVAHIRWIGSWRVAVISVQRRGGREADPAFRRELLRYLEPYRMTGCELEVIDPQYVSLHVSVRARLHPGYHAGGVRAALVNALGNGTSPDGTPGFFHPINFTFGQPVHRSQFIARAMAVPGVAWVELGQFRRADSPNDVEHIPIGPLEIARLENNLDLANRGTLQVEIETAHEQYARQSAERLAEATAALNSV